MWLFACSHRGRGETAFAALGSIYASPVRYTWRPGHSITPSPLSWAPPGGDDDGQHRELGQVQQAHHTGPADGGRGGRVFSVAWHLHRRRRRLSGGSSSPEHAAVGTKPGRGAYSMAPRAETTPTKTGIERVGATSIEEG